MIAFELKSHPLPSETHSLYLLIFPGSMLVNGKNVIFVVVMNCDSLLIF